MNKESTMHSTVRSKLVLIAVATLLQPTSVGAQSLPQPCFAHLYAAAHATPRAVLQLSVDKFKSAGCDKAVEESSKELTASSAPTANALAYLAYVQSVKRLEQSSGAIIGNSIVRSGIGNGGSATSRVELQLIDTNGKVVKLEAPANLLSKEALESLAKPSIIKVK